MKSERVVLVDGTWLCFRAFFAIPASFRTATGLPTNATYGFATMFRKLMSGRRPAMGAVIFDAPGTLHRELKYPAYKAQRPPMPAELGPQFEWIERVVVANGFPTFRREGWEADDVIGTLARIAAEASHEVVIVAGDKDFAQLIDDRVRMFDPMRDVTFDAALAFKKWGVRPDQMVDLLALVGDAVDNVPGVAGIGEKSAVALLAAYGSVDGVYAHLDDLPGRQKTALQAGHDSAMLSRELATIDRHAPIGATPEDLRVAEPDAAALDALYRTLEFRSLLTAAPVTEVVPTQVIDGATAAAWFAEGRVAIAPVYAPRRAGVGQLVGLGLAIGDRSGYLEDVDSVRAALAGPGPKVTHDTKSLLEAVDLAACDDTMLASFCVEPTRCIPHRIDQLAREYLQRTVAPWSGEAVAAWAGEHARAIAELWPVLEGKLAEAGLDRPYREREMPLVPVLADMERAGILVDREDLARLGVEFRARRDALESEVHALAGRAFNLGSTQQLATVLFEELKLPVIKKNKTGYSTDAEVLETLARAHPIAARLLEHRSLAKLINTYTDVLQSAIDPMTGRIHARFQQTVGVSGRLISTDPDLQRTPVRTPEGRRIRQAFVAPPGHLLMSADWSQIELRVLAHFSRDPLLCEAFRVGADVHRQTAAQLFGVAPDAVTREQRTIGKTINFATIYGQGATALAQILGIPRKEAQTYIERFFATYAGVRAWLDATIAEAGRRGFVTTLAGRRRFIPELSSHSPMDRTAGERIAANTPIQGSAADLCKAAMIEIHAGLQGTGARMLLQVHDELVLEVPEAEVDATRALVERAMAQPLPLTVPLEVNIGVARTWGDAH